LPSIPYELPDGQTINVENERFAVSELFFNPEPIVVRRKKKKQGTMK